MSIFEEQTNFIPNFCKVWWYPYHRIDRFPYCHTSPSWHLISCGHWTPMKLRFTSQFINEIIFTFTQQCILKQKILKMYKHLYSMYRINGNKSRLTGLQKPESFAGGVIKYVSTPLSFKYLSRKRPYAGLQANSSPRYCLVSPVMCTLLKMYIILNVFSY